MERVKCHGKAHHSRERWVNVSDLPSGSLEVARMALVSGETKLASEVIDNHLRKIKGVVKNGPKESKKPTGK